MCLSVEADDEDEDDLVSDETSDEEDPKPPKKKSRVSPKEALDRINAKRDPVIFVPKLITSDELRKWLSGCPYDSSWADTVVTALEEGGVLQRFRRRISWQHILSLALQKVTASSLAAAVKSIENPRKSYEAPSSLIRMEGSNFVVGPEVATPSPLAVNEAVFETLAELVLVLRDLYDVWHLGFHKVRRYEQGLFGVEQMNRETWLGQRLLNPSRPGQLYTYLLRMIQEVLFIVELPQVMDHARWYEIVATPAVPPSGGGSPKDYSSDPSREKNPSPRPRQRNKKEFPDRLGPLLEEKKLCKPWNLGIAGCRYVQCKNRHACLCGATDHILKSSMKCHPRGCQCVSCSPPSGKKG